MAWAQDIAINTLWRSNTDAETPATSVIDSNNVSNGSIAVNTLNGKAWIRVTGGGTSGWEEIGAPIATPVIVANGGTGVGTHTANGVLVGNGTSNISTVDLSGEGKLLVGHASSSPVALARSSTNNHVLVVDTSTSSGLAWAAQQNDNTQYTATGNGLTLSGTEFSHTNTSSQGNINGSGNAFIQDVTLDEFGHVTALNAEDVSITGTAFSATAVANRGVFVLSTSPTTLNDAAWYASSTSIGSTSNTALRPNVYAKLINTDTDANRMQNLGADSGTDLVLNGADYVKTESSSERYKENIASLSIDTSDIFNLIPKQFKYKDGSFTISAADSETGEEQTITTTGADSFGYIAEEVVDIIPELVSLNSSNQPEAVRYKLLTVLLLEELKALRTRVASLES